MIEPSPAFALPTLPPEEKNEQIYVFSVETLRAMGTVDPRLEALVSGHLRDSKHAPIIDSLIKRFEKPDAPDYLFTYVQPHPDVDLLPTSLVCVNFSRSGSIMTVTCWNAAPTADDFFRYTAPRVHDFAFQWAAAGQRVLSVIQTPKGRLRGRNLNDGTLADVDEVQALVARVQDELIGRFMAASMDDPGMDELDPECDAEEMDGFDPAVIEVGRLMFEVDLHQRAYGDNDSDYDSVEELDEAREAKPLHDRLVGVSSIALGWYHVDPKTVATVLDLPTLARLHVPYSDPRKSYLFTWFDSKGAQCHPEVWDSSVVVGDLPGAVVVAGSYLPEGRSVLYFCFGADSEVSGGGNPLFGER